MLKKILIGLFLILIAFCVWHWEWVGYGYWQAKGQLKVITGARPIAAFLANPDYPDSLKRKLRLTQVVRKYAVDSLGLHQSDNYTKLYDQGNEVLLWNVSASEPFALEPYLWHYPFLGKMPYKGFFDLEKAKIESNSLKEQGYDVRIRPVGGWSTLGILEDPLLSNMLDNSDGALAEVIIHELTHATIFVKDQIDFNENLASFIGEKGAEKFLIWHYGDSSEQHLTYIQEEADSKIFTQLILQGAKKLDSLYSGLPEEMLEDQKLSKKQQIIQDIIASLKHTNFYNSRYQNIFDQQLPNNAYFMAVRRYHDQEDSLISIYNSYDNNFKSMVEGLKTRYGK